MDVLPLLLIIGILSVQDARAQSSGCMQNLAQDEGFMRCTQGFTAIMQEMQGMSNSGTMDPKQMYASFCSPEGKSALKCLMDFVVRCPEVQSAMAMGGEGGLDLDEIMSHGGIDVFCEITTSDCQPVMERCMPKLNSSFNMMGPDSSPASPTPYPYSSTGPTPYSMIPAQMGVICGPMNDMITCILNAMDQCPSTAAYMETMLEKWSDVNQKQQPGAPDMPTFAESKAYILDTCPSLPEDFNSKQQCILMSVGQPDFSACYKNVTDHKKTNCDLYFGGKECVMTHVGTDCGKPYAEALVTASPLFSKEIPSNCEPVGGVSNLQASLITMIVAGILCLLGRF